MEFSEAWFCVLKNRQPDHCHFLGEKEKGRGVGRGLDITNPMDDNRFCIETTERAIHFIMDIKMAKWLCSIFSQIYTIDGIFQRRENERDM